MVTRPVAAGLSARSVAILKGWETRRAKYGAAGASPDGHAKLRQTAPRPTRRRQVCARGHRLTRDNVLVYANGRMCRECSRLRSLARRQRETLGDRPIWVEVGSLRINVQSHDAWCRQHGARLWAAVLAAHPDRGGTAKAFGTARRAWDTFLRGERRLYGTLGLPLPDGIKGQGGDA